MTEAAAPILEPDESAYAARAVIATALPEALTLRNLYDAVRSRKLAPVYNLERPETDYYLEQLGILNRAMDGAVRTAGGLIICHEKEELDDSEEEVEGIQVVHSRIKGSYFQVSEGLLLGFLAGSPGTEQAVSFGPENIATPDGEYQPRELLYVPTDEAIREVDERKRQEYLDRLRQQHRRASSHLRRVK